jgi:FimV-like protein
MSLPGAARSLGLGDIRVDSALNEPLTAQIDIVGATRDELAALTAKVANRDVFLHYAADRPSFLASATFKVGLDGAGRPVLNVRSSEPFTDPVVSLLVDLRWGNGELIREYPLLLDPPGFASPRRAATDQPASASAPRVADAAGADLPAVTQETPARAKPAKPAIDTVPMDRTTEPAHAGRTADGATPSPAASGDQVAAAIHHTVAPRETLRGIVRHAGASTETHAQRMMIAVFRANPHAFEGNINVMHVGAVLSIPPEDAVMAIDATDARREVRAHVTAWRLKGRPASTRRLAASDTGAAAQAARFAASGPVQASVAATASLAATAHVPTDAPSTDTLKGRVQSLEQALDELHKQLAQENTALENLKQQADRAVSQPPQEAAHAAGDPAPGTAPAQASAAPAQTIAAPVPATAAPATALAASSGVHPTARVEVIRAAPQNEPTPSPADLGAAGKTSSDNKLFGTIGLAIAPAVALVVGGVVFVRRRALKALERSRAAARTNEPMNGADAPAADAQPAMEAAAPPSRTAEPVKAAVATTFVAPPMARSVAPKATPAAAAAPIEAPAARETAHAPTDQTTQELEIDTELLERSYLDALAIDTLGIDTSDTGRNAAHSAPADTANELSATHGRAEDAAAFPADGDYVAHDATGTGLETVALDASELDTAIEDADLHTAILEANKIGPAAAAIANATPVGAPKPKLDYNLTDLDATAEHIHAQHVQMPSALHDHVVVSERRMNIVDVLKAAIERDPQRRDLQMKLLETYYAAAAMNRRAFLDVVVKLSRARDMLTAEDWQHVEKMGEEIAPTDALFLSTAKDDAAAA